MPNARFTYAILLVLSALLGSAWIVYSREPVASLDAAAGIAEAPLAGFNAPDFTLTTLTGEELRLAELRGRPVVLNFWATWCPPCRVEMPFFQDASVQYNGRAAVIGVNQGEETPTVSEFITSFQITYPIALDSDNRVSKLYDVRALPTTYFIDANGIVREVYTGVVNGAVLEDRIEKLLQEG
ncbi:MAG: TlpA disulfide reductase family protein [Chloroflexota bacterium]